MKGERPEFIKPGLFSLTAAADGRRGVFDMQNELLLAAGLPIGAVFIGDSITDMWALDAHFRSTGELLVNRGIGGDRTPFVRKRFEADVLQLHPRLVVIMIGVNNFWDLDLWWDLSQVRPPDEIEEEIVTDIAAMIEAASQKHITLAVCSILPTNIPFNGNTAIRNAAITRVNGRVQQLAQEQGAIFVDYHRHLVDEDGLTLRAGLAEDGLHPHSLGYRIMADTLLEALAEANMSFITRRVS